MSKFAYRYEISYSYSRKLDGDKICLELEKWDIIKETPGGYWIQYTNNTKSKRWISKDARNSFAYIDKRKALRRFISRKKFRTMHLDREKDRNVRAIEIAESKLKKIDDKRRKEQAASGNSKQPSSGGVRKVNPGTQSW